MTAEDPVERRAQQVPSVSTAEALLHRLRRLAQFARARVLLRSGRLGRRVAATGRVVVHNEGRLTVGNNVTFVGGIVPTEIVCLPGAEVSIGAGAMLNYGVSLEAHESIRLGDRCMLGSFVRIADRGPLREGPVRIGDDVWIAHGAVIEPGVTIGEGSVVAAGSVVTGNVPPHSMAIGNPARTMTLDVFAPRGT